MRIILLSLIMLVTTGCSTVYPNNTLVGQTFPSVTGESLEEKVVNIPEDFDGDFTLLLVGYKQDSQFDIDRWLIGLDMTNTAVDVYELPTIKGLFPRMFSTMINNGMRKGIPKDLWKGVITIYEDGEQIQKLTGNQQANNARVLLLDKNGVILYFYDDGFSVSALKDVRKLLTS